MHSLSSAASMCRVIGSCLQATGVASSAEYKDYLFKAGDYRSHAPGYGQVYRLYTHIQS